MEGPQAAPLLEQAAGDEGRRATEANALLVNGALQEMGRYNYDVQRVERMAEVVLKRGNAAEQARARYLRAQMRLNVNTAIPAAEEELRSLGAGSSEWADDALYLLASRREGEQKYTAALEIYDAIVKRFSPVTSNMRSSAESRAHDIRQPTVSLSCWTNELPGLKPTVQVSWRNVKTAKWTLKKVDPVGTPSDSPPSSASELWGLAGAVASTWTSPLDVKIPYAARQPAVRGRREGAGRLRAQGGGRRPDRRGAPGGVAGRGADQDRPGRRAGLGGRRGDRRGDAQRRRGGLAVPGQLAVEAHHRPHRRAGALPPQGRAHQRRGGGVGQERQPLGDRARRQLVLQLLQPRRAGVRADRPPALQARRDGGPQALPAHAHRGAHPAHRRSQGRGGDLRPHRQARGQPRADDQRLRHRHLHPAPGQDRQPGRVARRRVQQPDLLPAAHQQLPRRGVQAARVHRQRRAGGQPQAGRAGEGEGEGQLLLRRAGGERAGPGAGAGAAVVAHLGALARRAAGRSVAGQAPATTRSWTTAGGAATAPGTGPSPSTPCSSRPAPTAPPRSRSPPTPPALRSATASRCRCRCSSPTPPAGRSRAPAA